MDKKETEQGMESWLYPLLWVWIMAVCVLAVGRLVWDFYHA